MYYIYRPRIPAKALEGNLMPYRSVCKDQYITSSKAVLHAYLYMNAGSGGLQCASHAMTNTFLIFTPRIDAEQQHVRYLGLKFTKGFIWLIL